MPDHDYTPDRKHSAAYGWAKAAANRLRKFFGLYPVQEPEKGPPRPTPAPKPGDNDIKAGPG